MTPGSSAAWRRLVALGCATLLAGCASGTWVPARPRAATSGDGPSVVTGERFRRDRMSALRRFEAARPAVDSGGECVVRQAPTPGQRLLVSYFPTRAAGEVMVTLTVDSAGRLLQYHERRGLLHVPELAGARTAAQRDSILAAAERGTRTTDIWLDRETREARAVNRGGGEPSEGIFGLVSDFETARELGRPGSRAMRVAALCREAP